MDGRYCCRHCGSCFVHIWRKIFIPGGGLGFFFIGLNYAVRMSISGIGPWNLLRYINIFSFMNTNEVLGTAIQLYFSVIQYPYFGLNVLAALYFSQVFPAAFIAAYQFRGGRINLFGVQPGMSVL